MRIDRVKLIAEMARQDVTSKELCRRALVSPSTVSAARGGKSLQRMSCERIAAGLGIPLENLLEVPECRT